MSGIDALCECVSLKGSSDHSKHYGNVYFNKRSNEARGKRGQRSKDVGYQYLNLGGSHRKVRVLRHLSGGAGASV